MTTIIKYEKSVWSAMKRMPTNFNENRKLQNEKYILSQFAQENSYTNLCECICKYIEIEWKNACQTAYHTYLWVGNGSQMDWESDKEKEIGMTRCFYLSLYRLLHCFNSLQSLSI